MKRVLRILTSLVVAIAFGAAPVQAADPTAVEYAAGSYQGFFLSSMTGENGMFSMDLTPVRHRQLDGNLMVTGMSIPFNVTIGSSQVFTAVGEHGAFVVHGNILEVNGDGSVVAMSNYKLGADRGTLLFLKPIPTDNPAQLANTYAGSFTRDDGQTGALIIVVRQVGSSFSGMATFGDPSAGGMSVPYLATVGVVPPDPDTPIHVISLTPFATLTADATVNGDGSISGNVNVMFGDGSVHTASFTLRPLTEQE
jgi:hypothetical protein